MITRPLGQVRLSGARWGAAPHLGEGRIDPAEIADAIHTVAAALASGMTRLEGDFQDSNQNVPVALLGDLTKSERMVAIGDAAQEMAAIGSSVLEGVLKSYVAPDDYHTISLDIQRALRVARDARQIAASQPVRESIQGQLEIYFGHHVQDVRDLRDAAEQLVVLAENGVIPVREPAEEQAAIATGTLVAVGALVVGGLIWLSVS